jgi:hypothetical protein
VPLRIRLLGGDDGSAEEAARLGEGDGARDSLILRVPFRSSDDGEDADVEPSKDPSLRNSASSAKA